METEDRLKALVEGLRSLQFVLDVAADRGVNVGHVRGMSDRTIEDINELCGLQLEPREVAS